MDDLAPTPRTVRPLAWAAAVALAWVLLVQVAQCRVDLNLGDEGLLWYGVQRTLAGDWAIRDFQAYDPGRYLLLAGWARAVGSDGIVALRLGLAAAEWAALVPAVVMLARVTSSRAVQVVACGVLAVWMGPRHKLLDAAAAVWVTAALAALVERPDGRRHLLAGVVIGGLWGVGMNHAAYAAAATAAVVALLLVGQPARAWAVRPLWLAAGVAVGVLPMALLLLAVPGYAAAYWREAILPLVRMGTTNLTLPLPRPWAWRPTSPVTWPQLSTVAVAVAFWLQPVTVAVAAGLIARRWRRPAGPPLLVAAAATAAVWWHAPLSRADLSHVSQAIAPLVLLTVAVPMALDGWRRRAVQATAWPLLGVLTGLTLPALAPTFNARLSPEAHGHWQRVGGERLYLPRATAAVCAAAATVAAHTAPGETDLFVPYVPGLYAACRLRCPTYESYPLFPATADEQQQSIAGLHRWRTAWVVCWPYRIDGRPDLGYANTDPLVWQYICDHYRPASDAAGAAVLRAATP